MKQKHTLQELMGEIKLVLSRIDKETEGLDRAVITDTERPTFGYDKNQKFSIETAKTYMDAKLQSCRALIARLQELRTLRDATNMSTKITVNSKTMSIYDAIMFRDVISKVTGKVYVNIFKGVSRVETAATSASREGRSLQSRGSTPVEIVKLLDVEKLSEEFKEHQEMIQSIDSSLTVANATTYIEY